MKSIEQINKVKKKDNIIDGIMKSNGLYCLVARPKVGKSLLALQIADSLANNKQFLGFNINPSPVLYISTELSENQLKERIDKTNYKFSKNSLFFIEKDEDHSLSIRDDLLLDIRDFSEKYKGKFVIIDMLCGIDYMSYYDINSYKDIAEIIIPKYKDLIKKYNLTFLLIHHLNKNGTALGSTAIEGFVDGILYLKDSGFNSYTLSIINRDFESKELNLKLNNNLTFEIVNEDNSEIDYNMSLFLRHVIKNKECIFTPSKIVADLNMQITPTKFGRLLNDNLEKLKQEGIYIEQSRSATSRNYKATFIDPMAINESDKENE